MDCKLPIEQVRVGMFVSELDRPWLDTPFLLQGFLIEDEGTLAQLRTVCRFVVVDDARSIVPVTPDATPAPRQAPKRAPRPIKHETRPQAKESKRGHWLRQILDAAALPPEDTARQTAIAAPPPGDSSPRMFDWLRGLFRPRDGNGTPSPSAAAHGEIDSDSTPSGAGIYPKLVALEQELPPAADGFTRASDALADVIQDIRVGKGLEIEAVEAVVEDLVDSIVRNPEALQLVSRLRETDETAYGHALQVAVLLVSFGREIGFPREELTHLGQIGMLLDIGKLRVPAALLNKRGNLTPQEFIEVKRHVDHGLELIKASSKVHAKVLEGVEQHHERLDGSGYPHGLRDKQISVFGRMAGIVDCFSAMTSARPYADASPPYDIMRQLQEWSDTYFNAGLVQQFIQAIGIFPVGTLVELSTGEAAVVIEQHKAHRLKPKVLIITDADGNALQIPVILDLLYGTSTDGGALPYIRRGLAADSAVVDSSEFYLARA
ncbi:MAG: HD-GYP domain-containing protein [Burkholderiales bacterium]|nr:HD-GYP domain-containing protein [Burkholderiales bacterium]